jgi:hypothetical protein
MKIKVNKTVYEVEGIDTMDGMHDYTVYKLRKKNTTKTLTHNTTLDAFTLWGGKGYRVTMTTPQSVDFV